jgi:hypothetical protein
VHLFDDINHEGKKTRNDDELYNAIKDVFSSQNEKGKQNDFRIQFLKNNSWKATAKKYSDIYEFLLK